LTFILKAVTFKKLGTFIMAGRHCPHDTANSTWTDEGDGHTSAAIATARHKYMIRTLAILFAVISTFSLSKGL
jgi:hypothetical protein